ncbi:DUF4839 domain-containing protein [Actinomyces gerencseriae]|uniref:DUF4839 domain-containing protein n=1 Tax=Actinomyces gerencseriae TaxID=52769 RepID=UPI00047B201A|nr:DUF4839 domain-containing protein [Actinomyces gerencseriae]
MKKTISLISVCVLTISLVSCNDAASRKINAPIDSSEASSSNYQKVVSKFNDAGFTDVSTKEIDDLITGWLTEDGEVEEVSIGGDTSFSTRDTFSADTPVIVSYHTFPKKEKESSEPIPAASEQPPSPSTPLSPEPSPTPEATPSPTTGDETITVDNNEDFRALVQSPQPDDATVEQFTSEYKGRAVEFDGNIADVARHNAYNTRFDFLVYAGDYSTTSVHGPSFQFANCSYFNLNLTGDNVPDSVSVGQNLHIIAEVVDYNSTQRLLHLKPITTSAR